MKKVTIVTSSSSKTIHSTSLKSLKAVNTAKLAAKDDDLNSYEHFKTEAEIAEIVAHVTEALAKLDATKTKCA